VGSARDLLASSVIDSLLPFLERALEDVVYELLDRRRVPTRTELEALRERNTRLESQVGLLRKRIVALEARLEA
jgi:polyhydroxyalkanoate synthesis regulator phasin